MKRAKQWLLVRVLQKIVDAFKILGLRVSDFENHYASITIAWDAGITRK